LSKTPKTPLCSNCDNKLYVVNIRREAIGYICPQCDYHFIKDPTKVLEELAKRILEIKKPEFKKRLDTICPVCRKSKFVKCRKNTERIFKGCGFGPTTYVCWCENKHKKEPVWTQDYPKIQIVSY